MRTFDYVKKSSLWDNSKKFVKYKGSSTPDILILGEAPGVEENRLGKPFVGKCGKLLDSWLSNESNNFRFGISNVVHLMPTSDDGRIRKPSKLEVDYFKPIVRAIIKKYSPRIIICLGSTASESLLDIPISVAKNKVCYFMGRPVYSMYHPSYFLRKNLVGSREFGALIKLISERM